MKTPSRLLLCCALAAALGCELGPQSGRGLRLPDGDLARGRAAFQALGCATCHDIVGEAVDTDRPRAEHIVTLGGEVTRVASYGELVTSIVNPSHEISRRYPREQIADGDVSKMDNFNDVMTVSQLIDLTTFLQSKYEVREEPVYLP